MATARRLAIPASLHCCAVTLTGVRNGATPAFLTPEFFKLAGALHLREHANGVRQQ